MKPVILLFTDWFEPGYKAGGPIRSCVHFVQQMKNDYAVFVFTADRDLNDAAAYNGITINKWIDYDEGVQVFYCSPEQLTWKHIRQLIDDIKPGFIYLNSMFSRYFTIYPLLMKKRNLFSGKIVLAPRGMLRSSALRFKRLKKRAYLSAFRQLGLHKLIRFHATDDTEQADVRRQFGNSVNVIQAPNFPGFVKKYPGSTAKRGKELSVIFIGRLHPVKNLDFLLNLLPELNGKVTLTIVGSEEDKTYTELCKRIVQQYPDNIQVKFTGEIPNHQLPAIIEEHHIFALPTRGENFGHAIFEALRAGRPVLISDQTPWRGLETTRAGWDLSLENKDAFIAALQQALDFNQQQYDAWSLGAWQFVHDFVQHSDLKTAYHKLFS